MSPRALSRAAVSSILATTLWLAGCASPPRAPSPPPPVAAPSQGPWSGRLSLKIEREPPQSFFASFDLSGSAQAGQLVLTGPLGSAAAQLTWTPNRATLRAGKDVREFANVDALIAYATGTAVPAQALFDWLNGRNPEVAGWRADLSRQAEGRIVARRAGGPEPVELRIVLQP